MVVVVVMVDSPMEQRGRREVVDLLLLDRIVRL